MAKADPETARRRVAAWRAAWPEIAARHRDSDGRPPCYAFFYPEEEYRPELLEPLAEMARLGIADVECIYTTIKIRTPLSVIDWAHSCTPFIGITGSFALRTA